MIEAEVALGEIAPYKRPAEYILRAALPLTTAGKVRKQALKSELEC